MSTAPATIDEVSAEDYCLTLIRAYREAGMTPLPEHVQMIYNKLVKEKYPLKG